MIKIEKGEVYKAARFRSGENDRGPWEIIVVKEENRAHREVTIIPHNVPTGVEEGGTFRVTEITAAGPRRTKERDGSWSNHEKTFIEATVEAVAGSGNPNELDFYGDLGDDLDGSLGDDLL